MTSRKRTSSLSSPPTLEVADANTAKRIKIEGDIDDECFEIEFNSIKGNIEVLEQAFAPENNTIAKETSNEYSNDKDFSGCSYFIKEEQRTEVDLHLTQITNNIIKNEFDIGEVNNDISSVTKQKEDIVSNCHVGDAADIVSVTKQETDFKFEVDKEIDSNHNISCLIQTNCDNNKLKFDVNENSIDTSSVTKDDFKLEFDIGDDDTDALSITREEDFENPDCSLIKEDFDYDSNDEIVSTDQTDSNSMPTISTRETGNRLLNFFLQHPYILKGNIMENNLWMKEIKQLNSIDGVNKTGVQWLKTWDNYRRKWKIKLDLKRKRKTITEEEQRIYEIINVKREQRLAAITRVHWERLESFMHAHPELVVHPLDSKEEYEKLWENQTEAIGRLVGFYRTPRSWMDNWNNYKEKLMKKNSKFSSCHRRYIKLIKRYENRNLIIAKFQRQNKTSYDISQMCRLHLIEFFERNENLLQFNVKTDVWRDLWAEEIQILNSFGGFQKTRQRWIRIWNEYMARMKANTKNVTSLPDLDVRALELLKKIQGSSNQSRNCSCSEASQLNISNEQKELDSNLNSQSLQFTPPSEIKEINKDEIEFQPILFNTNKVCNNISPLNTKKQLQIGNCLKHLMTVFQKHPKLMYSSHDPSLNKIWEEAAKELNTIIGTNHTDKDWRTSWTSYRYKLRTRIDKKKMLTAKEKKFVSKLDELVEQIVFQGNHEEYWEHLLSFFETNTKLFIVNRIGQHSAWQDEVKLLNEISHMDRTEIEWEEIWMLYKKYMIRKLDDKTKELTRLDERFKNLLKQEKFREILNTKHLLCWNNLIGFFEEHPQLVNSIVCKSEEKLWKKKTETLNEISGLNKSQEQWRTDWFNYRTYIWSTPKKNRTELEQRYIKLLEKLQKHNINWRILLEFWREHPEFDEDSTDASDGWWKVLVKKMGCGVKSVRRYQRMWQHYKSDLKQKIADILSQNKNDESIVPKNLSVLEYKVYEMFKEIENSNLKKMKIEENYDDNAIVIHNRKWTNVYEFILEYPAFAKRIFGDEKTEEELWQEVLIQVQNKMNSLITMESLKKLWTELKEKKMKQISKDVKNRNSRGK